MREVFREHRPTVVFHAAAYKHVGLMEDNPVEAVRNNAIATRVMARVAGDTGTKVFVQVSTDKAVDARDRDGRLQGARRVGRGGRRRALPEDTAYTVGAVRQRARLVGLGGADLPPPDRGGRPGDGHRPGHDALLHDDPGGGPARHPRGLAGAGRRGVRARDGRAGPDHGPGRGHDPLLGPGAGDATSRSRSSAARPGEKLARGPVQRLRAPRGDAGAEDPARPPGRRRSRVGGARPSTASGCSCWRATRPSWRPRCPSSRRAAWPLRSPSRPDRGGRDSSPSDGVELPGSRTAS